MLGGALPGGSSIQIFKLITESVPSTSNVIVRPLMHFM